MRISVFDDMRQCTAEAVQEMLPQVSPHRREQALKYKHTFGQFCCLKSWMMLSALHVGEMEFLYNEHGKPYFEGGPYFSISHCKEGIAVAIDDLPVGIDIEAIRHADDELIRRTMNTEERQRLMANSQESKDRDFTRLWTRKEAVVKMQGVGIESFEQLQTILERGDWELETFETEKYIYSIAYGKLHCFGA